MNTVEMVQTRADHPGADRDPSDQKRTGARTARRDESETENRGGAHEGGCERPHDGAHDGNRERTVRCESTWCAHHRCKTPSDMLTSQPNRACLCREVHGQRGDGRNRKLRWETSQTPKQRTRSTIEVMLKPFARARNDVDANRAVRSLSRPDREEAAFSNSIR